MRAAVDVGYGYTKAVGEAGGRAVFPSALAPARGAGDLGALMGGGTPRHRVTIEAPVGSSVAGDWWVGEEALRLGASRTWDSAASEREGYGVLVLAGLRIAGAEGPVGLAAGLPLAVWLDRRERRALRDRLEGLGGRVSVNHGPAAHVQIASVRVFPQALGAYLAALRAPGADRLAGRPAGVIDVGYRTTDFLLLEPREEGVAVPDEARSGSIDLGIGQAYEAVRQAVEREAGTLVPPGMVDHFLAQGGRMYFRGQERDLRPLFEDACRRLASDIAAHVRRAWAGRLDFLAAVVVAGGGGAVLAPHLGFPAQQAAAEPLYANAAGFLAMAQVGQAGGPVRHGAAAR